MGNIQVLDETTINQIAAGEVIDRPASIVKELAENAIDAMATSITIEIKEGGISLIRITDNGSGIAKEDIKTAFLRHATSKIKTAEDLLSVGSLGFRGEALSSIAAVSMVELITKTKGTMMGCRYEIAGGSEGTLEDVGVPDGTTFLIRNLFYNTPARKKFLKSATTEAGYISDMVQRIALSHPEISIRFIHNGRHVLNTSGNGNLKDVIYQIYGREITSSLLEVSYDTEYMHIGGFIAKPVVSRGNRNFENYFINGRYIKSPVICKGIEEGYKDYMMQHKYPFTALHFQIAQNLLDVNIHPAKMELKFSNEQELYPDVVRAISQTLMEKELIPDVATDEPKKEKKIQVQPKTPEIFETKRLQEERQKFETKHLQGEQQNYEKKVMEHVPPLLVGETKPKERMQRNMAKDNVAKEEEMIPTGEQMTLFDDKFLSKEAKKQMKIIGQVFDTYWIVEYGEKMFIIDQHAAHEKVLYERMMKKLREKQPISQEMNPPIILTLSMREAELVKKYREEFLQAGYDIEEFGGNDYAVHTVPFDLYSLAKEDLLMEMIDLLADEGGIRSSSVLIFEKIASMSCKAAVKGNHHLSLSEANYLLEELLSLENPYHCPHGRPTIISMSKYELEKKFKRIV